ncbi:hypothetical protein C3L33_16269, partial [Rhododendron williamsianum]
MTHFLRIADAIEDREPQLKVWVKQVREAAYDTADALDMYMLRLRYHHSTGFCQFVRKVSFFIMTLKARHQIASEVKGIKSRIINISEGHQRYSDIYGKIEQGSSSTHSDITWQPLPRVHVSNVGRDDGFKAYYRIHDLWREMIIAKSREQSVVTIASERGRAWPEKLRRLSVHHNLEDIQQSSCFTRLRSLLVFSATDSLSLLSKVASLGKGARLLTVLDLRGAKLDIFPNEIVKLFNLTYLSLRATNVNMIPKSIGKLKKLETLDLKQTNVTELPDEILKLKHLRHLLLYRYNDARCYFPFHSTIGFKAPARIGSLLYLQKLCGIEANHGNDSGIVLREVGKLTQLRRLLITMLQKEYGTMLCSSLEKLNNLRSLCVAAMEDEIIDLDSLSSPPQLLQRLYLRGRLEKIPHWIPSLHNLKSLHLKWSKLKDVDPLQSLHDLPNLLHLVLRTAYEGDGLFFKAGGFQKLKYLWLISLVGLKWVEVESSSMPLLEKLYLQDCKLMMELPSGVEHLANLKLLDLSDMSETLISSLSRDLKGGDYWKIAHIPSVWVGDSKSGEWSGRII